MSALLDHPFAEERRTPEGGVRLVARVPIARGVVFHTFERAASHAVRHARTIQVSAHEHVMDLDFLAKFNHSCDPTAFVDTSRRECVALRDVSVGEQLDYFYPATEWHMAEPFECRCRASRCLGRIVGAGQLPLEALRGHRLNAHIVGLARGCLFDAHEG